MAACPIHGRFCRFALGLLGDVPLRTHQHHGIPVQPLPQSEGLQHCVYAASGHRVTALHGFPLNCAHRAARTAPQRDDDCNGLTDREDPACGLFPVIYSPRDLPFSSEPSLPHAANTALLALSYARVASATASHKLRCWALAQVGCVCVWGIFAGVWVVWCLMIWVGGRTTV
jgi:hypothetical protein